MEQKLISAGVKNLRAYGYQACNKKNILTDEIYKGFFASMLNDNKGKGGADVDEAIERLLLKCNAAVPRQPVNGE